jgi:hypothetical protein
MTEEQRKDFEEAAEQHTQACVHKSSPTVYRLVKSSFLAGCEHAVPKWISVEERTPANNEWVWAWHYHGYSIKAMFVGQNKFGQMWRYDDGGSMATFNAPSHWQPLPSHPLVKEIKV